MPRYAVDLTTPEAVARQLNTVNPTVSGVPAAIQNPADGQYADFWGYVSDQCHSVSAEIMAVCNRSFVPYLASYSTLYRDAVYLGGNLWLREDLLLPSSFEIGGVTVDPASYSGIPADTLPYMYLNFDAGTITGVSTAYGAGYAFEGTWGYVENLSQAWAVVQAAFSCTANETTLPVTDAARYETFQYLRCETEMMQITARNVVDNELTVIRGVNGTTSAIHVAVPLETFKVVSAIADAATRWVAYRYQRRTDVGQTVRLPDGTVVIANGPEGVARTLLNYQRPVAPRSVKTRGRYASGW